MRFKILFFLLPLFLHALPGYFEPWGKDADLHFISSNPEETKKSSFLSWGMKKVIWFHQNVISPVDGPRSHFKPSSSNYMLQAIEKHGFFTGYLMGCDRLLRENNESWVYKTAWIDGQQWKVDPPP